MRSSEENLMKYRDPNCSIVIVFFSSSDRAFIRLSNSVSVK